MIPFVNRTVEWGVGIAAFVSVLGIVPRHCARLTDCRQAKVRKVNAVLLTLKRITLPPRHLRHAVSVPKPPPPPPLLFRV